MADGTFFPLESISSFKLGTVVKYATLFPGGFYGSAFGFFMNEDKWNKLSKQDQDAITSVSGEALARLAGKAWDAADRASLEEMKKAGIQILDASPELVAGVKERAKAIEDKWVQVGHRQGCRRRQGAGRVPRRAQARRRRQLTAIAVASARLEAGAWLDRALGAAAAALLFGLMVLTTADVIGRYIFNWPLRGAFEITELMLLSLIFAGLPLASRTDEHVTLDFIDMLLGPGGRALLRRLIDLVCGARHPGPRLAGVGQGRQDRRLWRHHRGAAHPGRAVRLFHGGDGGGHRHRASGEGGAAGPADSEPRFDPNKTTTT